MVRQGLVEGPCLFNIAQEAVLRSIYMDDCPGLDFVTRDDVIGLNRYVCLESINQYFEAKMKLYNLRHPSGLKLTSATWGLLYFLLNFLNLLSYYVWLLVIVIG